MSSCMSSDGCSLPWTHEAKSSMAQIFAFIRSWISSWVCDNIADCGPQYTHFSDVDLLVSSRKGPIGESQPINSVNDHLLPLNEDTGTYVLSVSDSVVWQWGYHQSHSGVLQIWSRSAFRGPHWRAVMRLIGSTVFFSVLLQAMVRKNDIRAETLVYFGARFWTMSDIFKPNWPKAIWNWMWFLFSFVLHFIWILHMYFTF